MAQYTKILTGLMVLISISLIGSSALRAQPFGIPQRTQGESRHRTLSSDNARFVFGQVSDSDKDKFMLDTRTGRLWRIAESGKLGIFLTPVSYRIAEGDYSSLPGDASGPVRGKKAGDR